jgi:hypothetical protein
LIRTKNLQARLAPQLAPASPLSAFLTQNIRP